MKTDDLDLSRGAPGALCGAALGFAVFFLALNRKVLFGGAAVQTYHITGTVILLCVTLMSIKRPAEALLRLSVLKKHGVRRIAVVDSISEGGRGKSTSALLHYEDSGERIAVKSSRGIDASLVGKRVYVLTDPRDGDSFSVLLSTAGEPDGTEDVEKAEVSRNGE